MNKKKTVCRHKFW